MKALRATAETYSNELLIEESQNSDAKCKTCGKNIKSAEARVTFKRFYSHSYYFHLQCFTPITRVRIDKNDPGIVIKTKKLREKVDEWIENWNRQFRLQESAVNRYCDNAVQTAAPGLRKAMVEVAKCLDVKTVVGVGAVSRGWSHVSWSDEVWRVLRDREFPSVARGPATNLRAEFIRLWFSSCAHCKRVLREPERHMLCPVTCRPKCIQCYSDKQHRPQRVTWVRKSHGMTPQLLKQLNINVFSFDGHDCIYVNDAIDKVLRHRKSLALEVAKRENHELDDIFGKEFFAALRSAEEKDFADEQTFEATLEGTRLSGNQKALLEFVILGKTMNKFNDFLAKVKTAIAVNFDGNAGQQSLKNITLKEHWWRRKLSFSYRHRELQQPTTYLHDRQKLPKYSSISFNFFEQFFH